jgi:hypothetical protein
LLTKYLYLEKELCMAEAIREQVLATLQNDWATYVERFHHLSPEAQATFLAKQGYARLADLAEHALPEHKG